MDGLAPIPRNARKVAMDRIKSIQEDTCEGSASENLEILRRLMAEGKIRTYDEIGLWWHCHLSSPRPYETSWVESYNKPINLYLTWKDWRTSPRITNRKKCDHACFNVESAHMLCYSTCFRIVLELNGHCHACGVAGKVMTNWGPKCINPRTPISAAFPNSHYEMTYLAMTIKQPFWSVMFGLVERVPAIKFPPEADVDEILSDVCDELDRSV